MGRALPDKRFAGLVPPLFVACCAVLLCYETAVVTGQRFPATTTLIVFAGSLLAYNVAALRISIHFRATKPVRISGSALTIFISALCVLMLVPLATFLEFSQACWLAIAAGVSFLYMFPASSVGRRIGSWRERYPAKNILVSLVWTISTVMIPVNAGIEDLTTVPLLFVALRRFLFIYALATLYDLPDTRMDRNLNVGTIAARYSNRTALISAALILLVFVVLTALDPSLDRTLTVALMASAIYAFCIILFANPLRNRIGYRLLVDSAMAVQAVLVLLT